MASDYVVGGLSHNSFDINADGQYAYIAALNESNQPQILRISTELSSDASLLYDPSAGSAVNLMAGDYDAYFIWAAGHFGGNDRAVATEDGVYWYVKNFSPFDYWYGEGSPLLVGPGTDNLVTISVNDNDVIHETYFVGDLLYWTDHKPVPIDVSAFDRLDTNVEEVLIGGIGAVATDVSYSIISAEDDGQIVYIPSTDTYTNSGTTLILGNQTASSANDGKGALRFQNVQIPNAATINSATLSLISGGSGSSQTELDILGNLTTNASNPTSAANYLAKARTSASVGWTIDAGAVAEDDTYTTPDISTILQEIVNQGGWVAGNAMMFFIEDDGNSAGVTRNFKTYDNDPAKVAVLTVNYTATQTAIYYSPDSGDQWGEVSDGIPHTSIGNVTAIIFA